MDLQHIFDIFLSALAFIATAVIKHMFDEINRLKDGHERQAANLSDFKTHVAANHPTQETLEKRFDKLEAKLDRIVDRLERAI